MKTIVAFATLALILSLCNLLNRHGHSNDNANSRQSGTSTESNSNASAANTSAPRQDLGSAPPPKAPGVPTSQAAPVTNANRTNAAPRAPISGGVVNGKATSLPQPAYPPIARAAHASGAVNVQVTLDESGRVISAHAVSGHPLLKASAESAARQAKFSPTLLSGTPVKVTGIIVYNFAAQ